ncbi:hypothetical protein [Streptomyces lichenis]|uniref:Uncharacterized protein n=1 Tax=Streptomyces lichenis TaxID=2306967 RepID=A0ABT0IFZ5_9ACTN|nr:hypothetical protein [Streptomyces lichenis]MCK8680177.1 hypothetical protein [Streptomyces lichenis]
MSDSVPESLPGPVTASVPGPVTGSLPGSVPVSLSGPDRAVGFPGVLVGHSGATVAEPRERTA